MLASSPVLRAALAAAALALSAPTASAADPAPAHDTVFLAGGGRARGLVVEDDRAAGVVLLQLPDGSFRRYGPGEVARVEYADRGGVPAATPAPAAPVPPPPAATPPGPPPAPATPPGPPAAAVVPPEPPPAQPPPPPAGPAAAPAAPYAYPPPPQAYPPAPGWRQGPPAAPATAPAPVYVPEPGPPLPFTLSLGLGGAYTAGSVGGRAGNTSRWWPGFALFQLELGARLTPATTLVLYLDGGGGDASGAVRAYCAPRGLDCGAISSRVGLAVRRAFAPTRAHTPWISVGTGYESSEVFIDGPWGEQRISFSGWEALKLGAGWDFRPGRWIGFGLFSGVSFATYSVLSQSGFPYVDPGPLGGRTLHVWLQVGGRLILFP